MKYLSINLQIIACDTIEIDRQNASIRSSVCESGWIVDTNVPLSTQCCTLSYFSLITYHVQCNVHRERTQATMNVDHVQSDSIRISPARLYVNRVPMANRHRQSIVVAKSIVSVMKYEILIHIHMIFQNNVHRDTIRVRVYNHAMHVRSEHFNDIRIRQAANNA